VAGDKHAHKAVVLRNLHGFLDNRLSFGRQVRLVEVEEDDGKFGVRLGIREARDGRAGPSENPLGRVLYRTALKRVQGEPEPVSMLGATPIEDRRAAQPPRYKSICLAAAIVWWIL
jgi:hypothetical protein